MKWLRLFAIVLLVVGVAYAQERQWTEWASDGPDDSVYADSTFDQYTRDLIFAPDLDQDGKPEIIFTDYKDGGRVHVFELVEPGVVQEVFTIQNEPIGYTTTNRSVKYGDLDGDGLPEIILARTGASGDVDTAHVGLWVYEWDGIPGSDNYGIDGQPTARILDFAYDEYGNPPDQYRSEDIVVGDIDGDGVQEVVWVNNGGTAYDNAYIFSVVGDIGGFFYTVVETVFKRTDTTLCITGSLTSGYGPMNLDGDFNPDVVIGIWSNVGFLVVEGVAPDQYNVLFCQAGLDPEDRYTYGKSMGAFDIDHDGKDEFIYGALFRSRAYILRAVGDDQIVVDTFYLPDDTTISFAGLYSLRMGNLDGNTNGDIYIGNYGWGYYDLEYNGSGALNDINNYTIYEVYTDFYEETVVYGDTDTVNYWMAVGPNLGLGDLDQDDYPELYFVTDEARSSGDYPYLPWTTGFLHILEYGLQSVEEWTVLPPKGSVPELYAAAPSPFARFTNIGFFIPKRGNVSLKVYDIRGRLVKTLYSGELDAGKYSFRWDGTDMSGRKVANGVYIYRLETEFGSLAKRVVLAR